MSNYNQGYPFQNNQRPQPNRNNFNPQMNNDIFNNHFGVYQEEWMISKIQLIISLEEISE